jgi:siroheme synthase-like protein
VRTYYPVFLDVAGKRCLVVGGGAVAARKALALARCGARVTVVAPEARPSLRGPNVSVRRRRFAAADLASPAPWLVVAATDDEALNARVAALCARRRIWANVADRPALCGFIFPSVARRGALTLAVSTGGASPALAKFVGRRLRREFGPAYAALARRLRRRRPALLRLPLRHRRAVLKSTLEDFVKRSSRGNP